MFWTNLHRYLPAKPFLTTSNEGYFGWTDRYGHSANRYSDDRDTPRRPFFTASF